MRRCILKTSLFVCFERDIDARGNACVLFAAFVREEHKSRELLDEAPRILLDVTVCFGEVERRFLGKGFMHHVVSEDDSFISCVFIARVRV